MARPSESIWRAVMIAWCSNAPPPIVPAISCAVTFIAVPTSRGVEPRTAVISMYTASFMRGS